MTKVRFNECLNKETRFFNISIGVILGSCTTGITVWALKNLLFGVAASVVGAVMGSFLMKEYRLGNIQKNLYWRWFGSRVFLGQGKVSEGYIEEVSLMYLSMLLDLNKDVVGYKEALISKYISHSSTKYMKEIRQYFSHVKEQYKQFGLSTYFAVKSLEINSSDNSVIAKGVLTTKFGDHGIDIKETSYFLSYDLAGSTLRLKEFYHIASEEELKKKETLLKEEEENMQKIEKAVNKRGMHHD